MSAVLNDLKTALVSWLQTLPELSGFTFADRPGPPSARPTVMLGAAAMRPWSTDTMVGADCDWTLTLLTETGSFQTVQAAASAIQAGFRSASIAPVGAVTLAHRVTSVTIDHDSAQDTERAVLRLSLLADFGDDL
ncbi:MAG: DUF3168 domain-containing protein [Pseudomonadota bacterium]